MTVFFRGETSLTMLTSMSWSVLAAIEFIPDDNELKKKTQKTSHVTNHNVSCVNKGYGHE